MGGRSVSVTEYLMKAGRFDVKFRPDAPRSAASSVALFDQIVVTPTRLDTIGGFTDARVLAAAIYAGVVTVKPRTDKITGQGLAWYLGTDDGRGDLIDTAITNTAGSLSTWVTSLCPSSLTVGTVDNTSTSTLTFTYQFLSRREAFAHMVRSTGAEYRVNPAGTIDAKIATTLFTNTPTVLFSADAAGSYAGLTGINVTNADPVTDVEDLTTKVIVVGKTSDGATVASATATAATSYKDFNGNTLVMERFVNAPTTPTANLSAYATATIGLYGQTRQSFAVSSRTYAAPTLVRPGDWVYVHDPASGLVDTANQVAWDGALITPVKLRCKGYTWPIQAGMGVYARHPGSPATYTDLTDWIAWENTDTRWEIGASISDPESDQSQLSAAFLGVNPEIVNRVASMGRRTGVILTDAAQTITTATYTDITWGSETSDDDAWHAAGSATITVPTGFAGRYAIRYRGTWSANPVTAFISLHVNGTHFVSAPLVSWYDFGLYLNLPVVLLAAADALVFSVHQASGSNKSLTSSLEIIWLGP